MKIEMISLHSYWTFPKHWGSLNTKVMLVMLVMLEEWCSPFYFCLDASRCDFRHPEIMTSVH